MIKDGDFIEAYCPKCQVLHWVPAALWEVCLATRNDDFPKNAHCPYGHSYVARRDADVIKTNAPAPPPPIPLVKKKPRRFWQKDPKPEGNVINLKDRK